MSQSEATLEHCCHLTVMWIPLLTQPVKRKTRHLERLLLPWFNFHSCMGMWLHPLKKSWLEITYPFPNFDVEFWEWITNFIRHLTGYVTYHQSQYSQTWDDKCLALIAQMVRVFGMNPKIGVRVPISLSFFLCQKLRHFHQNISSWVENENMYCK